MPTFTPIPSSTYLGAYNPNVSGFVSIDLAVQNKDISFDPAGDIENVTGNQKLIQDIMLFVLSPVGTSIVDPTWGNKSLSLLGEAISYKGQVEQLIAGAINDLQRFKSNEPNLRHQPLEASEQIVSVDNVSIEAGDPTENDIKVSIDLTTVLGNATTIYIPLALQFVSQ